VRNFAAIALISLLLFNIVGYQGLFIGLAYHHDQKIERFVDLDQFEGELTTLKVPIALPYPSENTSFERADRKFEFQGEHYRFVKQKLANDTLVIVCYKDHQRKQLASAFSEVVKTLADQNSDQPQSKQLPSFLKEYLSGTFEIESITNGWSVELLPHEIQYNVMANELATLYGPPRA